MKLNITKVIQALDLGEYAEAMQGQVVQVWLNPDRATLRRRELLIEEYNRRLEALKNPPQVTEKNRVKVAERFKTTLDEFNEFALGDFLKGIHEWFASLWSQHTDAGTHWTTDELVELNEADPALYQWMKDRSLKMMEAHRSREKKG